MICYFGRKNFLFASIVGLISAVILLLIPWESLRGEAFWDLEVYRQNFLSGLPLLERHHIDSAWAFFINEGVWDVFIRWLLADIGLPVETVFSTITLLMLFVFSRFIFIRHGVLGVLLIVNPLVIDLAFSQLRMAFALSLFIIAIELKKVSTKWVLLILSTFVHTALILFVGIFFLCSYFTKSSKFRSFFNNSPLLFSVIIACCVTLTIGPLRDIILGFLGDRRINYQAESSSILYASFWFFYGIVFVASIKKKIIFDTSILMAVIWVFVFLLSTLLGIYGIRFLSASFPFIVSAMLVFAGIGVKKADNFKISPGDIVLEIFKVRFVFSWMLISFFVIYSFFQWDYWIL